MRKEFPTEAEARTFAEAANKNRPIAFCPLRGNTCLTNCVCYENASVQPPGGASDKWRVYGPHCNNAMFFEHEIAT